MDNKELFSRKSIDYSLCRPSYPVEAVQWIRSKVSGDTVLDVGAGTGIFTKVLLPFIKDPVTNPPAGKFARVKENWKKRNNPEELIAFFKISIFTLEVFV